MVTEATLKFLADLKKHNRRDWFQANRKRYEAARAEAVLLCDAVIAGLARFEPHMLEQDPEDCFFRINRDTRFSKDKSPFKTSISGVIPLYRGGMMERVGLYFELGPSPFVACGRWMMEPPVLKRYRKAVADERTGPPFAKAVAKAVAAGFEVGAQEQLARVPKGFAKDHPRAELLRHKGFALSFPTPTLPLIESGRLVRWSLDHVKAIAPLMKWVERAARGQKPSFS